MRLSVAALASVLLMAGAVPLPAQNRPAAEALAALSGDYQLTSADGTRACSLSLSRRAAPRDGTPGDPHAEVAFDRTACGAAILFSAGIAAWSPGPGNAIRLHAASGALIAEFTEGVGGTWEALREGDGVYFLIDPRLAEAAAQTQPAELFGLWDLARTFGRPACRVRLSDAPSRPNAYRLDPDAGCRLLFGRFMPDRWRLERGDLMLESVNGGSLRFAPYEEGGWGKVPEDNRPLFLMRTP